MAIPSVWLKIASKNITVDHVAPEATKLDGDTVYFRYKPATDFAFDDQVSVGIYAADKVGNSSTKSYGFHTQCQLPDLAVVTFNTSTGKKVFAKGETIELNSVIISHKADCNHSFTVRFDLDEHVTLDTMQIANLSKDTPYSLAPISFVMPDSQNHKIRIELDICDEIKEESESNNASSIDIYPPSLLSVTPNPFTPNDDGTNDEAVFNFETFRIDGANLKIFDIHGHKIYEQEWASSVKRISWNGRDGTGRPVLPGVYLYIFSDRSKPLARGCVVVAK